MRPFRSIRSLATLAAVTLAVSGCGDGAQPSDHALGAAPSVEPPPPQMRRLTMSQYANLVHDSLGADLVVPDRLEPDPRFAGWMALGSSTASVSPRGVERFEGAAYAIAAQVVAEARRAQLPTCQATVDAACTDTLLSLWGRRLWRRSLTNEEHARLRDVATEAAGVLGDPYAGLEFALAALLQAPDFLFRIEHDEAVDGIATRELSGIELASRLSFLLWDSGPDDALLDAAESGELSTDAGLRAHAERLIADPRARRGMAAFTIDWLHLDELDALHKEPEVFLHMSPTVGPAAREETLRLIEHFVFDLDADFRDILTTRTTFLDRELAAIYDVRAPAREGFGEAELPDSVPRRGLLGHVSFLAKHAHPVSSSPTLRGMFVREALLCQVMPEPPADVNTAIPEISDDAPTLRDRIAQHLQDPTCAACHQLTDPIGLAFEHFDGLGRYRTTEEGHPIDARGDLDGQHYDDAVGLADVLHEHPGLTTCMTDQWYRYATGRSLTLDDLELTQWLRDSFAAHGYRLQPLWLDIIQSDAFRRTGVTPQ